MIINLVKSILTQAFLISLFILPGLNSSSQLVEKTISDSLRLLPVELSNIPIRSAETLMKTRKIMDELISDDEISKLKNQNDSILNAVEAQIEIFSEEIDFKSIRFLENRVLQLQSQRNIVKNEMNRISSVILNMDKSLKFLANEQKVWTSTNESMKKIGLSKTVNKRIDLILEDLNSANVMVSEKIDDMLSTLDRSSKVSIEMDLMLNKMQTAILKLEQQLLLSDHPNIFNLDYSAENTVLLGTFRTYVKNEWNEIKNYSSDKINEFIITFLIFVLLIYLFFTYRNTLIESQKNTTDFYTKKLAQVLKKPISASILLTLFTTIIVFQNRPPAFKDLVTYLALIPLLLIMRELLNKKLLYIIYGFTFTLIFNIVFLMLQPDNVFFRFNLIFIGALELFLSGYFVFKISNSMEADSYRKLLYKRIGYLVLIMATIGLYAALSGNVMLAQILVTTINLSVILIAILFSTVITVNGIIISLIESKSASKINFIKNNGKELKKRIVTILNIATGYLAIVILFKKLNIWKITSDGVMNFFIREWTIGEMEFTLGTVFIFFLVIYISVLAGKIIQIILEGDVLSNMPLAKGLPHTIAVMVKYTFVTTGLFLAISAAGMSLSSMTVIIGAFSVGIGFGLQNIFNNMVSGFILLFERPVQIGDTIEVGALIGNVKSIGMRSSYIKTFDGAEVIVPNGQLISNEVINWTLSDQQRRIEVIVGVSYNSDPHKVHQLLKQILTEQSDIMSFPLPQVLFNELGDSSINFRLLFWTESIGLWQQIKSEVIFKIFDVLKENNIEIPFPQRDIHVRSMVQNLKEVESKNDTPD
jgi:small-conductance mechanosensitive channel